MFGAASAIVGVAVQNLVARVRSHADALAIRERDLEAVADLLRSLSLKTDARERICAGVCSLSGAHFAVLLEATGDGTLEWAASAGLDLPPKTFTPESGPYTAMTAYASRAAVFASDIGAGDFPELDGVPELADDRPAAIVFEPIHHGDEIAGVLVAGWRQPPPDDERRTRGLVRLLASEAAFVIERADLLGRLTESALTDELTGLPNRRALDERLEQAIREPGPLCVAVLDLDHFKKYNDDNGHQAGDRFLKEAAAAWRAQLRPTDMLARFGGEEFVVLLREDDLETARGVVRPAAAATPREQSCSAGVARREGRETAATLVGRADHALYEAKRAGRDQSLVAELDSLGNPVVDRTSRARATAAARYRERMGSRLAIRLLRRLERDLRHAARPHAGARQAGGDAGAARAAAAARGAAPDRARLGDGAAAGARRLRGARRRRSTCTRHEAVVEHSDGRAQRVAADARPRRSAR